MDKSIADIISQTRQNKQMTQEEFASRIGVTPQAVSRWERGGGLPDITLLPGICKVLEISANDLLGMESNKVVENNDYFMDKEIKNALIAEPLLVEFGMDFISCFVEGLKTDYVNQCRKKMANETGMMMPLLRIKDNINLAEKELQIKSYDRVLFHKKYEVIGNELYAEIIDEIANQCKKHYSEILNKQLVRIMIDNLKQQYPGVADGLIPEKISYMQVLETLRDEWNKNGNIRDLIHIVEGMETAI